MIFCRLLEKRHVIGEGKYKYNQFKEDPDDCDDRWNKYERWFRSSTLEKKDWDDQSIV